MSIGTAKPSMEEQDGVKHYFVDSHSVQEPLTSAQYEKEASQILGNEFQSHDIILMVGGSGLFIDALCHGLDDVPNDETVKNQLNKEFEASGLEALLRELEAKDPVFFARVDRQNPVRIIRALEVIRITGKPFSSFHAFRSKKRPYEIHKFVIDLPRGLLYERINFRVDVMMKNGLLDEVKQLMSLQNQQVLNTVGYSELFDYLANKTTLEEATELIKRNTRRYAKRQLTWFRRDQNAVWISETLFQKQFERIVSEAN